MRCRKNILLTRYLLGETISDLCSYNVKPLLRDRLSCFSRVDSFSATTLLGKLGVMSFLFPGVCLVLKLD